MLLIKAAEGMNQRAAMEWEEPDDRVPGLPALLLL
jgi:hypothetical protein